MTVMSTSMHRHRNFTAPLDTGFFFQGSASESARSPIVFPGRLPSMTATTPVTFAPPTKVEIPLIPKDFKASTIFS